MTLRWAAGLRVVSVEPCVDSRNLPPAVAPFEPRQAKLEELEKEMLEMNANTERLTSTYAELVELQTVLEKAGTFFNSKAPMTFSAEDRFGVAGVAELGDSLIQQQQVCGGANVRCNPYPPCLVPSQPSTRTATSSPAGRCQGWLCRRHDTPGQAVWL